MKLWKKDYESLKAMYEYYKAHPAEVSEEYMMELARELNKRKLEEKLKNERTNRARK